MARERSLYVCQTCGASHPRWVGRCEACGAWNTIVEEAAPAGGQGTLSRRGRAIHFAALEGSEPEPPRRRTGIGEFDRVTGGGLVRGSAILVGGDPGIGKSTLLLQAVAALAAGPQDQVCAYVSGEEAIEQVRLRARRLGLSASRVDLAAATAVADIVASLDRADPPQAVVIDSIQTMAVD